jgi:hypothetical protein
MQSREAVPLGPVLASYRYFWHPLHCTIPLLDFHTYGRAVGRAHAQLNGQSGFICYNNAICRGFPPVPTKNKRGGRIASSAEAVSGSGPEYAQYYRSSPCYATRAGQSNLNKEQKGSIKNSIRQVPTKYKTKKRGMPDTAHEVTRLLPPPAKRPTKQ